MWGCGAPAGHQGQLPKSRRPTPQRSDIDHHFGEPLSRAMGGMSAGESVRSWFSEAHVILIPKKLAPGAVACAAMPGKHRLVTLGSVAQWLIANAIELMLGRMAAHTLHEA